MNLYWRLFLTSLLARFRPKVSLWEGSHTPFRVLPNDLDVFRHLTNSRYLAFGDLGRLDLLSRGSYWRDIRGRGWFPVVTAQTITYKRSLKLWQKFQVHTRVLGFDDRHSYLQQSFVVGDQLMARSVVQIRFLKRSGGSVTQAELEEVAGGYPIELELPAWVKEWADSVRISKTTGPA
jgi:acyl-CoA thioesterase FadM